MAVPAHATTPAVSVVTPLYNSARHIDATLQSLLAQTLGDWEAILVDDGSTDDTGERVRPYLADPRFTYVSQDNRGIAGARNRGIGAARGDWVALLDHDDRWKPCKLERQLGAAAEHGWDIVCSDAEVVRDDRRTLFSSYLRVDTRMALERGAPSAELFAHLIRMNFLCACTVLLRRSLFTRHGLHDASVEPADDYDMWLRCLPQASLGYVPEPLAEYVLHDENHSWRATPMHEAAIRVLLRTYDRCAGDEQRREACMDALVAHHALLFGGHETRPAGRRIAAPALRLTRRGMTGLRILRRSWRTRHQESSGF